MFKSIREALAAGKGELTSRRKKLAELEQHREDLRSLARTREDLATLVCDGIDQIAAEYPKRLAATLDHYIRNPMEPLEVNHDEGSVTQFRILTASEAGRVTPSPKTLERAMLYLFKDQMKAAVRKAIAEMPYPETVGAPLADREKEIFKVERDIATHKSLIAELEGELASVHQ